MFLQTLFVNIEPSIDVVKIGDFRNIDNFSVGLLQTGYYYRHVPGCSKVVPVLIFEVFLFDIEQQFGIESSLMSDCKAVLLIRIVLDYFRMVGSRVAEQTVWSDKVSVHKPYFFSLEYGVEKFKDQKANHLIVPIDNHKNLLRLTKIASCI